MANFIKKIRDDKKEYREMQERAKRLPDAYYFVFQKIEAYTWECAGGDGIDTMKAQGDLLDLFEISVADGRAVLEVTGNDVAGFCDEFFRDTRKWSDAYQKRLNRKLNRL